MRILFLAGANSVHSHRWIGYFANTGHDVWWVSFAPSIREIPSSINYREIRSRFPMPLNLITYALKTRAIIRDARPDILHAHSIGTYGFVAFCMKFHPLVLTAWGSDIFLNPRQALKRIVLKKILRAADVITYDGANAEETLVALGARRTKLHSVRFGVDTRRFAPRSVDKAVTFGTHNLVVISIRNLEPLYDIETVIRAARIVADHGKNAHFIIGGSGSEEKRLRALAHELLLEDVITFIGAIPNDKMPDYLNAADIYVSTSLSDSGLASSTSEAMATELPVIVSDSGDNKKAIRDDENGYVIPVKSPERLAEKIIYLAEHADIRKKFAKANRARMVETNDYHTAMATMEGIYKSIS